MKYLTNHLDLLKCLLHQLDLRTFESHTDMRRLSEAACMALNNHAFKLSKYEIAVLRPVLETLKNSVSEHYIQPEKLSVRLSMPKPQLPENLSIYFQEFKKALREAKDEQLLSTLEVWASSIAVNNVYDDLSLFDFIRTTIGVASCLEKGEGKLRLLGGTISGIQAYLYEILSKNAAKLLKGRSFYIQLLTDSLLDEVLGTFDLSLCHIVYSSGGGFYVLIPDTEGVSEKFEEFRNTISKQIYAEHRTALFAELAITEAFEFSTKISINAIWDDLFEKLGKLKYKRLHNNNDFLNDFFDFIEVGGTKSEQRDPITNEEFRDGDRKEPLYKEANKADEIIVKRSTKDQIELGRDLRGASYWIKSEKTDLGKERRTIKDPFGTCHYLLDEKKYLNVQSSLKGEQVIVLNKTDKSLPFVFYGGNEFPIDPTTGYAKGFDELIENDKFKRLAILRMDVDGLGAIFSGDIGTSKYVLNWVRYVSVSRSLDQFFKGYLNELQKPYKDTSVIIYSGGDDLFIVGKWDDIVVLSEMIYLKFKEWSCDNLTLSGGIVLLPNKFPVMQGARLAEEVERKAKNHEFDVIVNGLKKITLKKNALTFLGTPLRWDTEFALVKQIFEDLEPLISSKTIDKSYLSKIYAHAFRQFAYEETQKEIEAAKKENRTPKPHFKEYSPAWRWTMAYDMARYKDRVKDAEAKKFIDRIATACFVNGYNGKPIQSKYSFLQLLQLATRWVELASRATNNND